MVLGFSIFGFKCRKCNKRKHKYKYFENIKLCSHCNKMRLMRIIIDRYYKRHKISVS